MQRSIDCVTEGRADQLCYDFRKMNNVMTCDAFPLPRLKDCTNQVGCAQFLATVDLLLKNVPAFDELCDAGFE